MGNIRNNWAYTLAHVIIIIVTWFIIFIYFFVNRSIFFIWLGTFWRKNGYEHYERRRLCRTIFPQTKAVDPHELPIFILWYLSCHYMHLSLPISCVFVCFVLFSWRGIGCPLLNLNYNEIKTFCTVHQNHDLFLYSPFPPSSVVV